ncbi:ribonuclease H-like domain-containing protein [Parasitella parasitica]|nr:ribonuclease H-like domain-containing protein [Parasitella parasitica]
MLHLDGVVLIKEDHSFKIIDHMAKINGVSTFSCLYTVLNEHQEIRLQVLAPTKSLDHLAYSFNNMMESYTRYGFQMPEVFYTDNVIGDRLFLESAIPSLKKDVVHTKPTLAEQINTNCPSQNFPLAELPGNIAVSGSIAIGFDCEWAVRGGRSAVPISEQARLRFVPVALVQIAYQDLIYLMRIHTFDHDKLPKQLSELIVNPKILKIGKNVNGDLSRFKYFGINYFPGQLKLGTFCKDKNLIERRGSSLAEICGFVLKVQLPKTNLIRCGNWEAQALNEEQINYAALDAWVSLEIYNRFKSMPTVHQKVSGKTRAGSFVAVHLENTAKSSVAALGFLCDNDSSISDEQYEAADTHGAVKMKVVKTMIPGFPLDCYDGLTLSDFTGNPCTMYIKYKYLFTASERVYYSATKPVEPTQPAITIHNSDEETPIPSRVLKDGFHLMDMIKISKSHGMHKDFMRRFRDALYVCDQGDKALIETFLLSTGTDWNTRMLSNPAWVFERVRRFIPKPAKL